MTANGSPIRVNGQTKLELQIGEATIQANFIIAKDLSQELIIGVDILATHKCIVDFDKHVMQCRENTVPINIYNPPKPSLILANGNIAKTSGIVPTIIFDKLHQL